MGTTGTVLVDRGGYEIYDLKGNKTSEFKAGNSDLVCRSDRPRLHDRRSLRELHRGNPQGREAQRSGLRRQCRVTMLQLSNIAWEVNRELHLDTKDGRIQNDPEAMKMWGREYEKGWAPHV
jgi:hypothetical protein